jgi:hypothetical protein
MIKSEENKYSMYKAVKGVLLEDKDTISAIPAFSKVFEEYNQLLEKLSKTEIEYQSVAKGATATKNQFRSELVSKTISIAAALYVFARQNKNEQLKAISRLTPSGLKLMRDLDLAQKATVIFEEAQKHKQTLVDFGIDELEIKELADLDAAYRKALAQQGDKQAQKKAARQRLRELFDEVDEFLKETLDYMIEVVKTENSEFYNKYQIARMIKDL